VFREHLRREERITAVASRGLARLHAEYPEHPHRHPLRQLPSETLH
jgi:hypothetical protein